MNEWMNKTVKCELHTKEEHRRPNWNLRDYHWKGSRAVGGLLCIAPWLERNFTSELHPKFDIFRNHVTLRSSSIWDLVTKLWPLVTALLLSLPVTSSGFHTHHTFSKLLERLVTWYDIHSDSRETQNVSNISLNSLSLALPINLANRIPFTWKTCCNICRNNFSTQMKYLTLSSCNTILQIIYAQSFDPLLILKSTCDKKIPGITFPSTCDLLMVR